MKATEEKKITRIYKRHDQTLAGGSNFKENGGKINKTKHDKQQNKE
jgi:hypothetical protein